MVNEYKGPRAYINSPVINTFGIEIHGVDRLWLITTKTFEGVQNGETWIAYSHSKGAVKRFYIFQSFRR